MTTTTTRQYRNMTALYGFKEEVTVDPRAPREWFEQHADVVLYPCRGAAVPWGYWRDRGYALEWPVEMWLATDEAVWLSTAQEDVSEDSRLGSILAPVGIEPTERHGALATLHALYGFDKQLSVDLALADPEWLDANAAGVIYSATLDDLPVGYWLGQSYLFEIVSERTLPHDDPRVALAREGIAVYTAD